VAWLSSDGTQPAPELSRFLECRTCSAAEAPAQFARVYAMWRRWAPEQVQERIEDEQTTLQRATPMLLQLTNVERWCEVEADLCKRVRFEEFGLTTPSGCSPVSGAYTQATWDQLIAQLVDAVRASGRGSQVDVERFLRDYRRRYALEWEAFVRCVPEPVLAEVPEQSAYLRLLRRIAENTAEGSQWSETEPPPEWFGVVQELVRTAPLTEGEIPPGAQYQAFLEELTSEIQRVRAQPQAAIGAARSVSADPQNVYQRGLQLVERLVPVEAGEERAVRSKLRTLLELPILNGFSSTLSVVQQTLDEQWKDRVVGPFSGSMDSFATLRGLYDPQSGALAQFDREQLDAFYRQDRPVALLRSRGLGFGSEFKRWIKDARALQRGFFSDEVRSLRVVSKPGELEGRTELFLTQRVLELECPQGVQTFAHTNAGAEQEFVFRWSPACDVVRLELVAQRPGSAAETLPQKTWSGPFALGRFLRGAQRTGERFNWRLDYGNGLQARVQYQVAGAGNVMGYEHRSPPSSIQK